MPAEAVQRSRLFRTVLVVIIKAMHGGLFASQNQGKTCVGMGAVEKREPPDAVGRNVLWYGRPSRNLFI